MMEVMTIFISMMTMMMMMPKASLECSISNLFFIFLFRCLKNWNMHLDRMNISKQYDVSYDMGYNNKHFE